MRVLSLFDGISCAKVALLRAWIDVSLYCASELDKYAIYVSKNNFPENVQLGDVRNIEVNSYNQLNIFGFYTNIDLLIGWSPCQDLSIAKNNRKGLDWERSGLFWEYVRILRELKPKYWVLENVASMPQEARDTISKELWVEPILINAALVSAQNRKRLFWTNIAGITQPVDKGILLKDILEVDRCEKNKSNTVRVSGRGSGAWDKHNRDSYIVQKPRGFNKWWEHHDKAPTLSANSWEQNNKLTIRLWHIGKGSQAERIYSPEWKSVTLSANWGGWWAKTWLYDVDKIVRKLTPIECERLQCLPDNYTAWISDTQRYKCLWNAFNVDVVTHILSFIPKQ